jgi:signal transduction histidine kinase
MGLHLMNYRARMIGGSLEVQRVIPQGTLVTCLFPLNVDEAK